MVRPKKKSQTKIASQHQQDLYNCSYFVREQLIGTWLFTHIGLNIRCQKKVDVFLNTLKSILFYFDYKKAVNFTRTLITI